jgi:hypothetical protein
MLADPLGEQRLPQRVVDLVRARVGQVLALQPDARSPAFTRQALSQVERRLAPHVVLHQVIELAMELGIGLGLPVDALELLMRRDECLRDVPPAELPKP